MSTKVDILLAPVESGVNKSKKCFQSWSTGIILSWDLNFANHTNFQSLEVVCRGSETQPQVTENFHLIS